MTPELSSTVFPQKVHGNSMAFLRESIYIHSSVVYIHEKRLNDLQEKFFSLVLRKDQGHSFGFSIQLTYDMMMKNIFVTQIV